MSNGRVKAIARDYQNEAKPIMEKLYPGYQFVKAKVYYSDVVDGVYIRAVMRKIDERKIMNGYKTEKPMRKRLSGKDSDLQDQLSEVGGVRGRKESLLQRNL